MKAILTCAGILGGLMSTPAFKIPNFTLNGSTPLKIRAAKEKDVIETTELIRSAYSYWVENNVIVSPATQSVDKTRSHLLEGRGFVAIDSTGVTRATFSLDNIYLKVRNETFTAHAEHAAKDIDYERISSELIVDGRYLEFKKLAVDRDLGEQGIGRSLYDVAEEYARSNGYNGVILETVKEATWLYEWYLRMGFKVYGKHIYEGSKLETLLLVKQF